MDKNNHQKYRFLPYPIFFELKNYQDGLRLPLDVDNTIVFLDGFDELSEKNAVCVVKQIESIKNSNSNVRFVISGRDASLCHEFNQGPQNEILKLSYEINLDDENDRKLYYRYSNTPLSSLVFIPFYKKQALQDKYKEIKNHKQFVETIVEDRLKNDKKRKDYADGFSSRMMSSSKVDFDELKKRLSSFCFRLYSMGARHFVENDILTSFENDDFSECILKSSLIEEHEGMFSFVSNIYFEYFLALYFSSCNYSTVKKNLFLSNGKVKVQEIIVISMLLNILNNRESLYKKIVKQLSKQSNVYILLTDYIALSPENRFEFYRQILKEYNDNRSLIYYLRFRSSHNLLANIGSLSDCMIDLLPDEFKSDAVELHSAQINDFLDKPQKKNLVVFVNSVILLGLFNRKIWSAEQQGILKDLSIPIIKFFLNNPLAKVLDGLLSMELVLYWYSEYGWVNHFSLSEWQSLLYRILPNTPKDFYSIGDEFDFKVKLAVFNLFHKQKVVAKLFKELALRVLNTQFDNGSAGVVPFNIDDDYERPLIHVDQNITDFGLCLNEIDASRNEILDVFNDAPIENSVYKIRTSERDSVLEGLWKLLNKCAGTFVIDDAKDLFRFIKRYLDDGRFVFQDQVNDFCGKLSAETKIALLCEILKNESFLAGDDSWYHCLVVVELLDNDSAVLSKEFLEQIKKISPENYQLVVRNIALQKNEHLLRSFCNEILPVVDPVFVNERKKQAAAIVKFEHDKREMFAKETDVICDKKILLEEVNRVIKYVEKILSCGNKSDAWDVLHEMEIESIEHNIRWPHKEKYIRDVFSSFVIGFLKKNKFTKNNRIDRNAVYKEIDDCFTSESVFWRYVYIYYIHDKKKDAVISFLADNKDFADRIKSSMQVEVMEIIKCSSGTFFDKRDYHHWMKPFLYFSVLLYDSKLPDWFDKNLAPDLVVCAAIYDELRYHKSDVIRVDSIFEWLEECGITKSKLIEKSIKCYEDVETDSIRSRIIHFLSKVDDDNAIDFVIEQTKTEIVKEANQDGVLSALAHYWRSVKFDKTCEIALIIPFEKFVKKPKDLISDLSDSLVDYFCENASVELKRTVIAKVSVLEGSRKQELLRNLGEENAIHRAIDEFLNGASVNSYLDRSLYEIKIFNDSLFEKFIDLYEYSVEKSSERRHILGNWSLCVIKENVTARRYKVLKKRIGRTIGLRKESGDHWEGLQDILDEIEQKLYDNTLEVIANNSIKGRLYSVSSHCVKRVYVAFIILPIIALIIGIPVFGWDEIEPLTYIVGSIESIITGVLCFIDGKFKSPFQRIEERFG